MCVVVCFLCAFCVPLCVISAMRALQRVLVPARTVMVFDGVRDFDGREGLILMGVRDFDRVCATGVLFL